MKIKNIIQKISSIAKTIIPSKNSLIWASFAVFIFSFLFIIIAPLNTLKVIGPLSSMVFIIIIGLIGILIGLLFNLIIYISNKFPFLYRIAFFFLFFISWLFFFINSRVYILSFFYLLIALSFLGASIYSLFHNQSKKAYYISSWAFLIISIFALIGWAYWLIQPGKDIDYPIIASLQTDYRPPLIDMKNPGEAGGYNILFTTYGSGKDRNRPEFGKNADIITESVDGSKLINGWEGLSGRFRTRYFGFDESELPLNGLVWYPEGSGPFPIILIVHGNHLAQNFSDPGYEYLAKHFASRGMIAVSIDQNFLNGSITDVFSGLNNENDARGWLLLQHLKQWKTWNNDPDSPFFGIVDMDNIALIGHSRGGEAVAHAFMLNSLKYYPDDFSLKLDYDFNIVSLIAIAPCDGQYQPSAVRTPLKDINYFAIHGSHDADVTSFAGQRQFERISFSPDFHGFAASLYIYGANHGQFNTVWGIKDMPSPYINLYNLRQLLKGEDQRKIAKVFMTAFLESTIMNINCYRHLFYDYRSAPAEWLPETVYIQQYRKYNMFPVCNFQEDLDLTTATIPQGRINAFNMNDWYERRIGLKYGSMDSKAVYLGWIIEEDEPFPSYKIEIPDSFESDEILYLKIADTGNMPVKDNGSEENNDHEKEDAKEETNRDYIDFSIELTDNADNIIVFPISSRYPLQPRLEAKLGKMDIIHPTPYGENILQTMIFHMNDHLEDDNSFDFQNIRKIRLLFNKTEKGIILIDEIGFIRTEEQGIIPLLESLNRQDDRLDPS